MVGQSEFTFGIRSRLADTGDARCDLELGAVAWWAFRIGGSSVA